MHGRSSSEVKSSMYCHPACRVPGPACNWVVYQGCPDEHEDYAGQHAATFSNSTNSQSHRNGGKHALIDGEKKIRDLGRAH